MPNIKLAPMNPFLLPQSYIGKSFLGMALVAGSILVPSPATGIIALVSFFILLCIYKNYIMEAEAGIEPA